MLRMSFGLRYAALALVLALAAGCPLQDPASEGDPQSTEGESPQAQAKRLEISETHFTFETTLVDGQFIASDTFSISNIGGGTVLWSIDPADVPIWLDVIPMSGEAGAVSQLVTLRVNENAADLGVGQVTEAFVITSDGGNQEINVALNVTSPSILIVEPTELNFGAALGTLSFTMRNGGTQTLTWDLLDISTDSGDDWLQLGGEGISTGRITGTQRIVIDFYVLRSELEPGIYTGHIDIISNGGSQTLNVSMEVPEPIPLLNVTPAQVIFDTETEATERLSIRNIGTGTMQWSVEDIDAFPSWLRVIPNGGTVGDVAVAVTVRVDARDLSGVTEYYTITISAVDDDGVSAGSGSVEVTLIVPAPEPEILLTPAAIDLGFEGRRSFFRIENSGTGLLSIDSITTDAPWITIDPSEFDALGNPDIEPLRNRSVSIDFTVDRSALNPPMATGAIVVHSPDVGEAGGSQSISITVDIREPTLAAVPQVLDFSTDITEKLLAIFNAGSGTIEWVIDPDSLPAYLVDPDGEPLIQGALTGTVSGETTDAVIVGLNREVLLPGESIPPNTTLTLTGTVTEGSGVGTQRSIEVQILGTRLEKPILNVNTGVNQDGDPNVDLGNVPFIPVGFGPTGIFTITNGGDGILEWSIDPAGFPEWLTVSPLSSPKVEGGLSTGEHDEIQAVINREALEARAYQHKFEIRSNDPANLAQPIRVEMIVPKIVLISASSTGVDFGEDEITSSIAVANFGDDGTELNFGIELNKPWLFVFPEQGRSEGVPVPEEDADWQIIDVAIDRASLDAPDGGGTALITFYARDDTNERDDNIAAPFEVQVSVIATPLFIEAALPRVRVPSLVREIMLMRDLRFGPICIDPACDPTVLDPQDSNLYLPSFASGFLLFEDGRPLELTETHQFLTSAQNVRTRIVLVLDYSASTFLAALEAQLYHPNLVAEGRDQDDPDFVDPTHPLYDDPLQYIYERAIGAFLEELPGEYEIAIQQFHDRDQPEIGTVVTDRRYTDQPEIGLAGVGSSTGFIRNDVAGRARLMAALESIHITGHGATELVGALEKANGLLGEELDPTPRPVPVIPSLPFDDTGMRAVILISDGRLTNDFGGLSSVASEMTKLGTRFMGVSWGVDANPTQLAELASTTGGHLYLTREQDTGLIEDEKRVFKPSIDALVGWFDADANDLCDFSISEDLQSQIVLSYVTLNTSQSQVLGRTQVVINDPGDGICGLDDLSEIAGELDLSVPVGAAAGGTALALGTRMGQVSLETEGIVESGGATNSATVIVVVDYMPRDIVQLDFEIGFESDDIAFDPAVIGVDVTKIVPSGGILATEGIFDPDWDLSDPVDGAFSMTVPVDADPPTVQYGAFGRLLKIELSGIPAHLGSDNPGELFELRLFSVVPTTREERENANLGQRDWFAHPDTLPIRKQVNLQQFDAAYRAASFPTPEFNRTQIDFEDGGTQARFTVRNAGGALKVDGTDVLALNWFIGGGGLDLTYAPDSGFLTTGQDETTVTVTLNRDRSTVGDFSERDLELVLFYTTGIQGVQGEVRIETRGRILPPQMTIDPLILDFGSEFRDVAGEFQQYTVTNTGEGVLGFYRSDEPDLRDSDTGVAPSDWLIAPLQSGIVFSSWEEFGFLVLVGVDRSVILDDGSPLPPGEYSHDIVVNGTTSNGQPLSSFTDADGLPLVDQLTVHVTMEVLGRPDIPIIEFIPEEIVPEGRLYTGPTPELRDPADVVWSFGQDAVVPSGMTIDSGTGVITWADPVATPDSEPIQIVIRAEMVSDPALYDERGWLLTVTAPSEAPAIDPASIPSVPDVVYSGESYLGPLPRLLSGSTPMEWTLLLGAPGMSVGSTGQVIWPESAPIAPEDADGLYDVRIRVENDAGIDIVSWQVQVIVQRPVILSLPDDLIIAGYRYVGPTPSLSVGINPTWSLQSSPLGMQINPDTGVVWWDAPVAHGATPYTIIIRATVADLPEDANWDEVFYVLEVYNRLDIEPIVDLSDFATEDPLGSDEWKDTVNAGAAYSAVVSVPPSAEGLSGTIRWSFIEAPEGMEISTPALDPDTELPVVNPTTGNPVIDPETGDIDTTVAMITWVNPQPGNSEQTVTVRAESPISADIATYTLTVVDAPPGIDPILGAQLAVSENADYSAQLTLNQGSTPIAWAVVQGPAQMTVDSTGLVEWPSAGPAGPHTVEISATNAVGATPLIWTLTVNP